MSGTPTREIARRVFAREFNDAVYSFKESDDDRAPVYALLPTGAKANRVVAVGTVTEIEDVSGPDADSPYWQAKVLDTNGDAFFVYAGQYQPEAAESIRQLETPEYVSVVGKPRTYETDEGEINVSVRPESVTVVSEDERERWTVETANHTIERIKQFDEVDGDDEYAAMAKDKYGESLDTYRQAVVSALETLDENRAEGTSPTAE